MLSIEPSPSIEVVALKESKGKRGGDSVQHPSVVYKSKRNNNGGDKTVHYNFREERGRRLWREISEERE